MCEEEGVGGVGGGGGGGDEPVGGVGRGGGGKRAGEGGVGVERYGRFDGTRASCAADSGRSEDAGDAIDGTIGDFTASPV